MLLGFDLGVIARNWDFLILQGFLGALFALAVYVGNVVLI